MTCEITTINKKEWVDSLNENMGDIDVNTSKWFAHNIEVAGYMVAPTAFCEFNGQQRVIGAKSRKVTNFKDFVDYVNERKERIYVYQIIFFPGSPTYHSIDANTFEPKELDYPMISESFWKVRYGEVEND